MVKKAVVVALLVVAVFAFYNVSLNATLGDQCYQGTIYYCGPGEECEGGWDPICWYGEWHSGGASCGTVSCVIDGVEETYRECNCRW